MSTFGSFHPQKNGCPYDITHPFEYSLVECENPSNNKWFISRFHFGAFASSYHD
jgi:hypothetical protein